MLRIEGRGATYGELWFGESLPPGAGVDIAVHRQRAAPLAGARVAPFLTIVNDLEPEPPAILERFGKDCRYKIRRAQARDGLAREAFAEPCERLADFAAFYDSHTRELGCGHADLAWLRAACEARSCAKQVSTAAR